MINFQPLQNVRFFISRLNMNHSAKLKENCNILKHQGLHSFLDKMFPDISSQILIFPGYNLFIFQVYFMHDWRSKYIKQRFFFTIVFHQTYTPKK